MSKTPLLDQLRADEDRKEEEIIAPFVARNEQMRRTIDSLQNFIRKYEEAAGARVKEELSDRLASYASNEILKAFYKAMSERQRYNIINVPVDAFDVRLHQVVSYIVREVAQPRLSFVGPSDYAAESITVDYIQIDIPRMACRLALYP